MKTKTTTNTLHRIPVMLVTAASLVCASLTVPACDAGDETEQSITQRYSGEELFAGIIFDAGPASGKVAALTQDTALDAVGQMTEEEFDASLSEAKTMLEGMGMDKLAGEFEKLEGKRSEVLRAAVDNADGAELTALVISMINAEDPEFFDSFADQIQSGDHYLVAEALAEAGTKTLSHALALGLDTQAPADADQGLCIAVFAFIAAAITLTVAVNVNVAVNINVAATWNITVTDDSMSIELSAETLRADVLIDEITTAYAS